MRTSRSVRLTLPNAETFLFVGLLSAALFFPGATARAGDEPLQDPTDVEEPAQIAPDDAEAPSSEAPVPEQPSAEGPAPEQPSAEVPSSGTPADGAGGPRVLDRSLFRPDLQPGSEGATPPPSGQQGNQ